MAKKANEHPRLAGLVVWCPKLKKDVTLAAPAEWDWSASESQCEMCGTHGGVSVTVTCECGKRHEVAIKSW